MKKRVYLENTMWQDPIVEEVHAIREQLLAQFEGDLHKYCEFVRALPATGHIANPPSMPNNATPSDTKTSLKTD